MTAPSAPPPRKRGSSKRSPPQVRADLCEISDAILDAHRERGHRSLTLDQVRVLYINVGYKRGYRDGYNEGRAGTGAVR